jgi:hypothetical protein
VQTTGISGAKKGFRWNTVDGGNPLQYVGVLGRVGLEVLRLRYWWNEHGGLVTTSPMRGGIMSIKMVRDVLLWCGVINYGLLLWWFLFFTLAHDWSYRITGRWFRLSVEQFDAMNYIGMALFKTGILLFNLVPYVALRIVL